MDNNKPIKILQMIASLYRGGSQSIVMNLYKNIDRTKVQFDFVIDHEEYDDYRSEIEELGGKIYIMPTFKGTNILEVKKAWNDFFIKHTEYRILHSHSRSYASIYLPIAKKYGVKTIIHSHSTSNGKGLQSVIKNIMQYPLRYQADYYMACSKDSGKWLFGENVINSNKFYIFNNAIDTEKFIFDENIRKQYRKKFCINNERVFIQIGNYIKTKNHIFSLECFEQLLKINNNCKLYFVGSGGSTQDEIAKAIENKNLQEKVIMLGVRDDVNKLLQMADCYLMPSIYEGVSLAAIEAQTSGIQCILSDSVSKDVEITANCKFLPLVTKQWIKEMNSELFDRKNNYDRIVDAGYDIKTTSNWLLNFYKEIVNE